MKKLAVITMDVEDWYHTYFPECSVDRSISLLDGLDIVLGIMNKKNIKGSFFVVGEIADLLKSKIQEMDHNGHDIGCHNWEHFRPVTINPQDYREQLIRAKTKLESILGHPVMGYRAPGFGTDDDHLKIVREVGFQYDSSKIKPQKAKRYGKLSMDGFQEVQPCIYRSEDFFEFEVSTQKFGNFNVLLGGGYIRMLPWFFMKMMTLNYLKTGNLYVIYIHPIDLSPMSVPRVPSTGLGRYLKTIIGRKKMAEKFSKLIDLIQDSGYEFTTLCHLKNEML